MNQKNKLVNSKPAVFRYEYDFGAKCYQNQIYGRQDLTILHNKRIKKDGGWVKVDQIRGFSDYLHSNKAVFNLLLPSEGPSVSFDCGWNAGDPTFLISGTPNEVEPLLVPPMILIRYEQFLAPSGAMLLLDVSLHDAGTSTTGWKVPMDPSLPQVDLFFRDLARQEEIATLFVSASAEQARLWLGVYEMARQSDLTRMLEEAQAHIGQHGRNHFPNVCQEYALWREGR